MPNPHSSAYESGTVERLEAIGELEKEKARLIFYIPCWRTSNFGFEIPRAVEAEARIKEIDELLNDFRTGVQKWARAEF